MTPEQMRDFGRRYTEAWCSHDAQAVASFYDMDGRIVINGGEPAVGRAAIVETVQGFFNAFPDLIVKMDTVRTSGTHGVYLWTLEGANTGSGGTGNRVKASGWEYWRFSADGRVVESHGHFDADDYERQLNGG